MATHNIHYKGTYMLATAAGLKQERRVRVARACQMLDECTPSYLAGLEPSMTKIVTQVKPKEGAILAVGNDFWWQEFANVHHFHFGGRRYACQQLEIGPDVVSFLRNRCVAEVEGVEDVVADIFNGVMLHMIVDSGVHRGYYGHPSTQNWVQHKATTPNGNKWKALQVLVGWMDPGEVWGHMLRPELDRIENCFNSVQDALLCASASVFGKSYYANELNEHISVLKTESALEGFFATLPNLPPFEQYDQVRDPGELRIFMDVCNFILRCRL